MIENGHFVILLVVHFVFIQLFFSASDPFMLVASDVFLGFPSTKSCNLESKLMEERCKYLVAELVCKVRQM